MWLLGVSIAWQPYVDRRTSGNHCSWPRNSQAHKPPTTCLFFFPYRFNKQHEKFNEWTSEVAWGFSCLWTGTGYLFPLFVADRQESVTNNKLVFLYFTMKFLAGAHLSLCSPAIFIVQWQLISCSARHSHTNQNNEVHNASLRLLNITINV